jgi:signal transduction histidine kinase
MTTEVQLTSPSEDPVRDSGPGFSFASVPAMHPDWHPPLPVTGVRLSLWRAVAAFRVATVLPCLFLIVRWQHLYARPGVAFAVGAAMLLVTVVIVWLAVTGRAHRPAIVGADLGVTLLLTLATIWAQTPAQRHGKMVTLTTVWAGGPVLEAAFLATWIGGALAACVQMAAAIVVRDGYDGRTLSSGLILIVAGAVTGYVATLTVRAEHDLAVASATQAAVTERERLARSIHDGVLQVLGLVHRAGREAGGEWAALGAAAAEQETALRALITARPLVTAPGRSDLADDLRALRSERVTVSAPAEPLIMAGATAGEVVAAVRAALHNVAQHAGPHARAWVLLERLDDTVCVTVRDDGGGFTAGRLEAAEQDGRLGVAASIRRRIEGLGGRVAISSVTGEGTMVEMVVPGTEERA